MLDLRTRIRRLSRRSICFSKSNVVHDAVIGCFINLHMFSFSKLILNFHGVIDLSSNQTSFCHEQ